MKTEPARNSEETKKLIAKLDKLVEESDVTVLKEILDFEKRHALYMGKQYGRSMNQFEMYFSVIVIWGHTINYLDKKKLASS